MFTNTDSFECSAVINAKVYIILCNIYTYIHIYKHINTDIYACVHIHVYIYIYICMYVHVCLLRENVNKCRYK